MEYNYENIDVMQCIICSHVQYATSDRCLLCGGELKLASKEVENALREKDRKLFEKAMRAKAQKAIDNLHEGKFDYRENVVNSPRCPLCKSTNIRKISIPKRVAGGYAFGLFSNTARSQWECLNCNNKF